MPFVLMVIIFIVVAVVRASVAKTAQEAKQQQQRGVPGAPQQRPVMQQTAGKPQVFNVPQPQETGKVYDDGKVFTKPVPKYVPAEKSREQLAEEAKRIAEAIMGSNNNPARTAPSHTDKADKYKKPVVRHQDDDCGGGSIHDGYHEGVSGDPFGEKKPRAAVAGNLGKKLAAEDDAQVKAKAEAENAKRALARISKLPPMAQGIIYSEILGKPKSEIA